MFQLRRILLSGLVALLMVGMVAAGDDQAVVGSDDIKSIYIGSKGRTPCDDNQKWECLHIEIGFDFDFPW